MANRITPMIIADAAKKAKGETHSRDNNDDVFNTTGCGIVGEERGFTGHTEDMNSDLVYMQQRYYDPSIGRFLSIDPVDSNPNNPMTFNRYAYANNNPYKYIDPDGRLPDHVTGESDSDGDGIPNSADNFDEDSVVFDPSMGSIYADELKNRIPGGAGAPPRSNKPVTPGDVGSYGDLNTQRRKNGQTEPLHMDHQPSLAAQVRARENTLGRPLTKAEIELVKKSTPAIASPREIHQQTSPTYGGRNNPSKIASDAQNLNAAQARDRAVFNEAMRNR